MSLSTSHAEPLGRPLVIPGNARSLGWACLFSFAVHAVMLVVLGLFTLADKIEFVATLSSVIADDITEPPILQEVEATETTSIGNGGDFYSFSSTSESTMVLAKDPQREIEKSIESTLDVPIPVTNDLPQPTKSDVLTTVATTGTTEHAGGVEGAIDRIALEIANSLREKKTLVVWLFDVSPSLTARRAKIAERVETIYQQLTELNVGADKALKSAVAIFGETCTIVTPKPLDESAELIKTVQAIKSDTSGDENSFSAILKVAKHFLPFRTEMQRDVMFILVTDEEGSDPENLDQAILLCKRYGMRCYCVGDSAPFGRKTIEMPFQMQDGEQVIGVMQKGPESRYAELLRLGYWGIGSHDLDEMPSGFGPYGLTRLCTETNGLYFIADEGRGKHRFDSEVLRNYAPDYRPIATLDRDIQSNQAKQSLIEACLAVEREAQNRKVLSISMPRLEFKADNDTVLRRELTEAQKPIADLDASLDHLLHRLEQGVKDRAKVKEARWRASYDLAIGRALALRVRAFGYNSMLAEMKSNPKKFEQTDNNLWLLVPSSEISSGIAVKKMATRAKEYLVRVLEEHPGTPWALLAERENNVPMGWEWKESHYSPNPMMAAGTRKAGPKFIDVEDNKSKTPTKKPVVAPPQRREI